MVVEVAAPRWKVVVEVVELLRSEEAAVMQMSGLQVDQERLSPEPARNSAGTWRRSWGDVSRYELLTKREHTGDHSVTGLHTWRIRHRRHRDQSRRSTAHMRLDNRRGSARYCPPKEQDYYWLARRVDRNRSPRRKIDCDGDCLGHSVCRGRHGNGRRRHGGHLGR